MKRPTIHYLPIESIPARYTEQMHKWVRDELDKFVALEKVASYFVYVPEFDASEISSGQFLDNYGSLIYKQQQLALVIAAMREGIVASGDIVLVGDIWYPGLEAVKMAAELSGISLVIAGWHYAGVYDPNDYYSKTLNGWSRAFETMLVKDVVDVICCGSEYHRDFLCRNTGRCPSKTLPLGLVWNPSEVARNSNGVSKENLVVFPHRLAPEKSPDSFIYAAASLSKDYPSWKFVFSVASGQVPVDLLELNSSLGSPCSFYKPKDKSDYYALLARASVVYSSGHQETFGYAVHEGLALGCVPCLPERACYSESVKGDKRWLYSPLSDPWGALKLKEIMESKHPDLYPLTAAFGNSTEVFLQSILNYHDNLHKKI